MRCVSLGLGSENLKVGSSPGTALGSPEVCFVGVGGSFYPVRDLQEQAELVSSLPLTPHVAAGQLSPCVPPEPPCGGPRFGRLCRPRQQDQPLGRHHGQQGVRTPVKLRTQPGHVQSMKSLSSFHSLVRVAKITSHFEHCISHMTFHSITQAAWFSAKVAARVTVLPAAPGSKFYQHLAAGVNSIPCKYKHLEYFVSEDQGVKRAAALIQEITELVVWI